MRKDNAADAIFAKIFGFGTIIVYKYTNNFFFKVVYFRRNGARRDARPFFLSCSGIVARFLTGILRGTFVFHSGFLERTGRAGMRTRSLFLYAKTAFL